MTTASRRSPFRRDPHDREILRLALPAFGALIAEPLYVLADTAVVGHLGTEPLAGLAVAASILLTINASCIFLAYGTTAVVSRLIGAGEHRDAALQAVQGLWLAFGLGVALSVAGLVLSGPLVRLLGADGEVAVQAEIYLRVSLLGVPAMLLVLAGTGYLRGLQDTRTPLVVAVASASANLVVELVLIYGFGRGIGASALSTVLAQWGAAAIYVRWIVRAVRHHGVGLAPDPATMGHLGRVGRDLFVRTMALRGSFTLATAVAARTGSVNLAAHQIVFELWSFLALALDAIAIAGQSLIGHFLGADSVSDARAAGRRMLEWGVVAGIAAGVVLGSLHEVLPHLFTDDADVVAVAATLLVVAAVMQPVNALVFVLDGLLIGAGDLAFLAVAMVGAAAVFVAGAALVLTADLGIYALWAALGVFMVARLAGLLGRWWSGRWAVTGAVR
ncbi:MAG: MATE family efflux transporter [Acidimicrobiales bacterium]|jgi:putative MATE family efflux protein|nr:MATE family efflux transporter [Acidimicrobiales bacterium]